MNLKNKALWWCLFLAPLLAIPLLLLLSPLLSELLPRLIPPCPYHKLLGIYCLGCGGTRSVLALCTLDLITALRQNALVPAGLLLWLLFEIQLGFALFGKKLRLIPKNKWFWGILAAAALLFALLRNFFPAIAPF